ncbi:MAG TPA: hypothetical protein VI876_10935 [Dehalococcoidia bacterium]|nr:hypothetical protein [Dehalococcoidia bacterium]
MIRRRVIQRPNGFRCPDCGGPVVSGEGRHRCIVCGHLHRR